MDSREQTIRLAQDALGAFAMSKAPGDFASCLSSVLGLIPVGGATGVHMPIIIRDGASASHWMIMKVEDILSATCEVTSISSAEHIESADTGMKMIQSVHEAERQSEIVKDEVRPIIRNQGQTELARTPVKELKKIIKRWKKNRTDWRKKFTYDKHSMIGESSEREKLVSDLENYASSDMTILLLGETGTGKELAARAIHDGSSRKDKPFVPINCRGFPESLLESQLFGHVKGAFTGACKDQPGQFAMAEKGTLFLDEIGDTSLAFQVKVLRAIEEREYLPVGASKVEKADVRIVCATNRNLQDLIKKGEFRDDLYFRISVAEITIAPLRERIDDVPILAECFLKKYNPHKKFSVEVMWSLIQCDWPGNVRELENEIERTAVFSRGNIILTTDLKQHISQLSGSEESKAVLTKDNIEEYRGLRRQFPHLNITELAPKMGVSKTTLYDFIKDYGLQSPKRRK